MLVWCLKFFLQQTCVHIDICVHTSNGCTSVSDMHEHVFSIVCMCVCEWVGGWMFYRQDPA